MNRLHVLIRMPILLIGILYSFSANADGGGVLVGAYVDEQPGAYLQTRLSGKSAVMFSAYASNRDYWVSGDLKYYLGDYADSVYLSGGVTKMQLEGFPAETIYRAGAGFEARTEGNVVYGVGATVWWNQNWIEPLVRGGLYVAYYR